MRDYVRDLLSHTKRNYREQNNSTSKRNGRKLYKVQFKTAEQLFIKHHNYVDITTDDEIVDCYLDGQGRGIKTFVLPQEENQKSKSEKIGEFGNYLPEYQRFSGLDLAKKIAEIYNGRLLSAIDKFKLVENKYHCLIVDQYACDLIIAEYDLNFIDIESLELTEKWQNDTSVRFTDGKNLFRFYSAKNTIFRTFDIDRTKAEVFNIDSFKDEKCCPHCKLLLPEGY